MFEADVGGGAAAAKMPVTAKKGAAAGAGALMAAGEGLGDEAFMPISISS
jgi:hypothetical protein